MAFEFSRFEGPIDDLDVQRAFQRFSNEIRAEEEPTFPPRPFRETVAVLSRPPRHIGRVRWLAFDADRVVGAALVDFDEEDVANLHVAWSEIQVEADRRRLGIGRRLASEVGRETLAAGRRLVMAETLSTVPAGELFAAALGAERGLDAETSELIIADIDNGMMSDWIDRGVGQKDRFALLWLEGPWPQDMHDEVVALTHVMNDAPFGELEMNDLVFTIGHITSLEEELASRTIARFTLAVQERVSGRLVGYTEVFINPSIPDLIQQGDTGVFPEFRGNGLGKWLKAEMVRRVMSRDPHVTRIRTHNASTNAPMLAINRAMGFTTHHTSTVWQIAATDLATA